MNAVKDDVIALVDKELKSANEKFPLFHSAHEGYAVILEEVEEAKFEIGQCEEILSYAWGGIMRNSPYTSEKINRLKTRAIDLATEAIQVAAMAQKFIDSMEVEK
jgi:hypothetical protein